jgi:hypothetical protein
MKQPPKILKPDSEKPNADFSFVFSSNVKDWYKSRRLQNSKKKK